jgi:hypothetical protein
VVENLHVHLEESTGTHVGCRAKSTQVHVGRRNLVAETTVLHRDIEVGIAWERPETFVLLARHGLRVGDGGVDSLDGGLWCGNQGRSSVDSSGRLRAARLGG